MNIDGRFSEYDAPYHILDLLVGPDGHLWFAHNLPTNGIGRITIDGVLSEFFLSPEIRPNKLTIGSDGHLWGTDFRHHQIVRFSLTHEEGKEKIKFQVYPLNSRSKITSIVTGPEGYLWFITDIEGNKIGSMTLNGKITEYSFPYSNTYSNNLLLGPDGNFWFVDLSRDYLEKFTPDGIISEYYLDLIKSPISVAADSDNLWVLGHMSRNIGRFSIL